jgi:hypothetical protein
MILSTLYNRFCPDDKPSFSSAQKQYQLKGLGKLKAQLGA